MEQTQSSSFLHGMSSVSHKTAEGFNTSWQKTKICLSYWNKNKKTRFIAMLLVSLPLEI